MISLRFATQLFGKVKALRNKSIMLFVLLLISSALLRISADVVRSQPRPTDASAQVNASRCYHKELEDLAFLEGDWDVNVNTRLANGEWQETKATSQIKRDLSGCLLVERFIGSRENRIFNVLGLFGFDNNSKLLQHVLTDSEHGLLALYQGRKIGDEICLDVAVVYGDGTKATVRRAYSAITNNSFTLEDRRSQDDGKNWSIGIKAHYRRRQ